MDRSTPKVTISTSRKKSGTFFGCLQLGFLHFFPQTRTLLKNDGIWDFNNDFKAWGGSAELCFRALRPTGYLLIIVITSFLLIPFLMPKHGHPSPAGNPGIKKILVFLSPASYILPHKSICLKSPATTPPCAGESKNTALCLESAHKKDILAGERLKTMKKCHK